MASIKYLLGSGQLFSPVLLHNLHYNNATAQGSGRGLVPPYTEAAHVQQPRNRMKCKKKIWSLFSGISTSSHSKFMPCTAQPVLPASMHNTTLTFLLIPTTTGSYLPCMYSSHLMLVSSFKGFDQSLEHLPGYRSGS